MQPSAVPVFPTPHARRDAPSDREAHSGRDRRHVLAGLAVECVGIGLAALGFTAFREATIGVGRVGAPFFVLGIAISYTGMLVALAGAWRGWRRAAGRAERAGFGLGTLGSLAQIAGLTWDNALHTQGATHFDPAHNLAYAGFAALLLAAAIFARTARRYTRAA